MKRKRRAVQLLAILAIAMGIWWAQSPMFTKLPTRVVPGLNSDQSDTVDVPVMSPDGQLRSHFKGRLDCSSQSVFRVDDKHYLSSVIAELTKQQQQLLGTDYVTVFELRDERHQMIWRRLLKGRITVSSVDNKGRIAMMVQAESTPVQPYTLYKTRLLMLSKTGQPLWSTLLPSKHASNSAIASINGNILLYSGSDAGNKWSGYMALVGENGKLIAEYPKLPYDMRFIGKDRGKYCFIQYVMKPIKDQASKDHIRYDPVAYNMMEMDESGIISKPVPISLKGSDGIVMSNLFQGVLAILSWDDLYYVTPWMKDSLKRVSHMSLEHPVHLEPIMNGQALSLLLASWGGQVEVEREWTVGVSYIDRSNSAFWKMRPLVKRKFYDEGYSLCRSYGSADALVILAGTPSRIVMTNNPESWIVLVNRQGNIVARHKIQDIISDSTDITVMANYCLVSLEYSDTVIELPMVATPLISTTPTADGLRVRITCATKGAIIRYSVDTRDPDSKGQSYRGEFTVPKGSTITARATAPRTLPSQIAEVAGK